MSIPPISPSSNNFKSLNQINVEIETVQKLLDSIRENRGQILNSQNGQQGATHLSALASGDSAAWSDLHKRIANIKSEINSIPTNQPMITNPSSSNTSADVTAKKLKLGNDSSNLAVYQGRTPTAKESINLAKNRSVETNISKKELEDYLSDPQLEVTQSLLDACNSL